MAKRQTPQRKQKDPDEERGGVPIGIPVEKVCFIIIKAREFEVKDAVTDPDPGSNPTDDNMASVLEDHGDDPVVQEITEFINALSEDEKIDFVTLAWLGRDDNTVEDWDELRAEAANIPEHQRRNTAAYLLGMPMVSEYLEEALAMFGQSCEASEIGRL